MDTQQNTALTRALAEVPGPLPTSGVIHITLPHTDRFTVVGNHLAQHPHLSCTAVGIAVRIQSLPQGTEVSIKALAARCQEGEKRIAAALRELEAHGYLQRFRHRLPGERVTTRTLFCNQPAALVHPCRPAAEVRPRPAAPAPVRVPAVIPVQAPAPEAAPVAPPVSVPPTTPSAPLFVPRVPPPTAPKASRRPLPQPSELTPELGRAATAFLSDLHRHAPQFALSEADVHRLVPGVAAWLERAARPDAIRRALTDDPPLPLKHPAKLLTYRLTELLPPAPPGVDDLSALARPRVTVTPFQTCDDCDRAFRSPVPGHCRDCREVRSKHEEHAQAAA
ncbi:helix-turn-helix domain-containing protein [Streptomyces sp. ID03-2B]|uniref:helix-turn-helix domain-containing protein n=1 Tax=unclassified Streptomyces TaxID=2593676 RepID=UPI0020BE9CFA|nr:MULTISPECIES: helix-turn-helix domain-containing protein [unclassified Streptomyces]MCL6290460.1 helix-turn-helix domain-containing protein [Streptomyces sp. 43Y-GA-1]MDX3339791.1 helix-turn-helix domain-containing protein [Streptomyces sp. ME02-6979.5a]MDX3593347.1 helix-turn-helix domain-containing protein [Streptomyces sp. ID03-2B]